MKIVLVGGGSGGHFYPLVAVAEALEDIANEKKLIEPELFYIGPEPFDRAALLEHEIVYKSSAAGKIRRYPSIRNLFDLIKTGWGIIDSIAKFRVGSSYKSTIDAFLDL